MRCAGTSQQDKASEPNQGTGLPGKLHYCLLYRLHPALRRVQDGNIISAIAKVQPLTHVCLH